MISVSVNFPDGTASIFEMQKLPKAGDTIVALGQVFNVTERGWILEEVVVDSGYIFLDEIEGVMIPPSGRYDHLHPN